MNINILFRGWNGLSQHSGAALRNHVASIPLPLPLFAIENSGNDQGLAALLLVSAAFSLSLRRGLFTPHPSLLYPHPLLGLNELHLNFTPPKLC